MKPTLMITTVLALAAGFASGASLSDPIVTFQLDISDPNNAYLQNVGELPASFSGFTVQSDALLIDCELFTGIAARVDGDVPGEDAAWVIDNYGVTALGMAEQFLIGKQVCELSVGVPATMPTWDPVTETGVRLNLGAFAKACPIEDLELRVSIKDKAGDIRPFRGVVVPEPTTLGLLAAGALTLRRRTRRGDGQG